MTSMSQSVSAEMARHAMVASQLRTNAVNDARVVAAMSAVPREQFVPGHDTALAYRDRPLPLPGGRAMNSPLATGRLLTEATIGADDRVLLIGAATGYTAAVLARLAKEVVAVESDAVLVGLARGALAGLPNVTVVEGSLRVGHPDGAPYDVLVVDGAIEEVPDELASQLRPGARVVLGRADQGVTRLSSGVKSEGGFGLIDFADCECVILPGFARPRAFSFAK
jgi:protein-L-isoaspartate(D-aspartate) O-methyltransferase